VSTLPQRGKWRSKFLVESTDGKGLILEGKRASDAKGKTPGYGGEFPSSNSLGNSTPTEE
jgi:hypothetical protein